MDITKLFSPDGTLEHVEDVAVSMLNMVDECRRLRETVVRQEETIKQYMKWQQEDLDRVQKSTGEILMALVESTNENWVEDEELADAEQE